MFHTGGDCVACQPLLFPTVEVRELEFFRKGHLCPVCLIV